MSDLGQQLISIVRAKAADNPDFVYTTPLVNQQDDPPCVYVYDGCPSCLIGHALFDAKLIDGSLECDQAKNSTGFTGLLDHLGLLLDTNEWKWLRQVQRYQDARRSWGEAVRQADFDAKNNYGLKRWNVA